MTARVLDQGGLDRFELALRRAQAPVLGHLRKGLSGAEMDALTESIGIRLPPEARTWWGWHDGAEIDVLWAREREVGPSMPFISLAEAVDQGAVVARGLVGVRADAR